MEYKSDIPNRHSIGYTLSLIFISSLLFACGSDSTESPIVTEDTSTDISSPIDTVSDNRPNILLIVTDDMALSDLGSFGSEINTPNLDELAMSGVRLANFHAGSQCAPSRAMLLSGTDNHQAGMGAMLEAASYMIGEENTRELQQIPGYGGYLSPSVASLPELLKDAGYHTYMTGKWHLGAKDDQSPQSRGFERSYALLEGGAGHLNDLSLWDNYGPTYRQDGEITTLPDDFYSTRFYTETLIDYIESNRKDGRPFFGYIAYTAPHWPLQAPRESIEKYKGKYDSGFDQLLMSRLQGLKDAGIIKGDFDIFPKSEDLPAWEDLTAEEQALEARKMEIYAAMVDDVDVYVGKLIAYLKEVGEYENTYIFFMSDNGPEARNIARLALMKDWYKTCCDNSLENIGNANSYTWIGRNWGHAHATPHRMFKSYLSEGGIHTTAFATFPKMTRAGSVEHEFFSVMDVMPTLLDAAGVEIPERTYNGRNINPIYGKSMLALLNGDVDVIRSPSEGIGMEIHGRKAYRRAEYKILLQPDRLATGDWQLYNLAEDPAELNDLSQQFPELRTELIDEYKRFAEDAGVVDWQIFKR